MAKFVVHYLDEEKEVFTEDLLKKHLEHLRNLSCKGILFFCGLYKDDSRGMLILEAKSLDEANGYIQQDPFIIQKYYKNFTLREIIEANENNNFLMKN